MDFFDFGRYMGRDDPAVDTGLEVDWFEKAFAGGAVLYHNIYLNDHVFLRLTIVSGLGLFAILPYKDKASAEIGMEVRRILGVDADNSVILFHGDEITLVLSRDGQSLTPIPDVYSFFHKKLQEFANNRIRVLDDACVSRLQGRLIELENGVRPTPEADEMIGSDGLLYVRRYDPVMLGPVDLGLAGKRSWYPVADEDTDRLVTMAAFGGWFGLHRFAEGEIAEGVLYLLTCGCAGILPALDIVQYLTGSRFINRVEYEDDGELTRVRTRQYLRKPTNRKWAVLCIFLAIIVALLAWRLIYRWALPVVLQEVYSLLACRANGTPLPAGLDQIMPDVSGIVTK